MIGHGAAVATVIVNFRTPQLSIRAARSALLDEATAEVIVVENGSGDDSSERLRHGLRQESRVQIVESPNNLGFGGGANLGASRASAPILFFLNSDAISGPNSITRLAEFLSARDALGAVAPRIMTPDGEIQSDAFGDFPSGRLLSWPGEGPGPEWISGAAFAIWRTEFEALGGFDSKYWMYWEDVDLCWRLAKRSKSVAIVADAIVIHGGGRSSAQTAHDRMARSSRRAFLAAAGYSKPYRAAMAIRGVLGSVRSSLRAMTQHARMRK